MANPMELRTSRCNYVAKRQYFANCDDIFDGFDHFHTAYHIDSSGDIDRDNSVHHYNPRNPHD